MDDEKVIAYLKRRLFDESFDESNTKEQWAKDLVATMYHYENSKKYLGEKFSMEDAKDVHKHYKDSIPENITCADIYVAINSQYHDFVKLYKSWFPNSYEHKIIESAIVYWFKDDDCEANSKIEHYFK
jgi:hypothetical protein